MENVGRIIRVFPRRTKWTPVDDLAFVGDPPLFLPPADLPVKISVTFTWDVDEGRRLAWAWRQFFRDVELGGPAFADPGGEFTPGMFLKPDVTITSRGCPRNCPWCYVPGREGKIRELKTIHPGTIVQDNNLLACSRPHIIKVFEMLRAQGKGITFLGGLDARLLHEWHVELLDSISVADSGLWFACDTPAGLKPLERVARLLEGYSIRKKRCFVMVGRQESFEEAVARLKAVLNMGFLPFSQLYRGPGEINYTQDWIDLNNIWCRPGNYRHKDGGDNGEDPGLDQDGLE